MKKLTHIITLILVSISSIAQIDVFDCNNNNYTTGVTEQAILNSGAEYFGTCITFNNNTDFDFNGSNNNKVTASQRIHIEEGVVETQGTQKSFHAGNYTNTGKMHLNITPDIPTFNVLAMNYPDLNAVIKYDKLELGIVLPEDIQLRVNDFVYNNGLNSNELNPYLDWETQVYCTFSHTSGSWYQDVQGFFYQDFERNYNTDSWDLSPGQENATDYPAFRVRFAPPLEGQWIAQVHIKINGTEIHTSPFFGFNVIDTGRPGFVKVHNNKKNLERDGKVIFPVGACLPYPGAESLHFEYNGDLNRSKKVSDYEDYNQQLLSFAQLGGKYTRIFFDAYCGNIEWNKLGDYTDGLKYVHEMDAVFEIFRQNDMLTDFTLMMHDPIADFTDYFKTGWDFGSYSWATSVPEAAPYCYTTINGVNSPVDMLTNWQSIEYIKQRYRYMVSRYGYSTNVYVYNLLSEPWHINQTLNPNKIAEIEAWKDAHPNYQYPDIAAAFAGNLYDAGNVIVPYDDYLGSEGDDERAAIQYFYTELAAFIKDDLSRRNINLLGAIGHMPAANDLTNPDGTGFDDDSWSLDDIDIVGISTYNKTPQYMYKSDDNNYSKTFKNIFNAFQKPILLVETDHSDGTEGCTFNEQAVMVMNRVGTSGCAGFNIWRTYGPFATEQDELVRVSNFMNSNFIANTFDAGNGDWKHQASLWKVKVDIDNSSSENVNLRELQFVASQDKSSGFGSIYNSQFNVQNYAQDLLAQVNVQTTNCYLGDSNGEYDKDGYMFLEGWERTNIKWNDKKKLKVKKLKKNTDYIVKFYDYDTYDLRKITTQNSSILGKLKIKHPKLSWGVQVTHKPIYNFTVEEVVSNKLFDFIENEKPDSISIMETKLYPNPNNGLFTIEHSDYIDSYIISDINGRIIRKVDVKQLKRVYLELSLSPGIYFVQINNSQIIKFLCYD